MYIMKQSIPKVSLIIIQIKLCVVISILKKYTKKLVLIIKYDVIIVTYMISTTRPFTECLHHFNQIVTVFVVNYREPEYIRTWL